MLFQRRTETRTYNNYKLTFRPHLPLIITAVLYAIVAGASYVIALNKAPMPFSQLNSVIDWASWYDVLIAFPILSVLCAIPFIGIRSSRIIVPVILISPLFLILDSFLLVYNLPSLGLLLFIIPVIDLVPVTFVALVYLTPLVLVVLAAYDIPRSSLKVRSLPRVYYVAAASISLILVAVDFFMRYDALSNSSSLISVVSDVGWAAQAGAKGLIHGINPYAASLPPWGGSAPLTYGPMEFVLLAPFAMLSIDVGAHVASIFYSLLAALGVFMTVRVFNPKVAPVAAMIFFVLPVTFYDISAAFTQHIIAASLISWTAFFYVTSRYRLSGLFLGLSGLTIGIPFALIIPFIFPLDKAGKIKIMEGYIPIIATLLFAIFLLFGTYALTSFNAFTDTINLYGIGQYLTPLAESILKWIPVAAIMVWFLYASYRGKSRFDALETAAIFLLILPFAVGYFFAFFFIWEGILLIIYVFIKMEVRSSWTPSNDVAS